MGAAERTPPRNLSPLGSGPVPLPVSEGGKGPEKQPPTRSLWSHHPPQVLPVDTEAERRAVQSESRAGLGPPPHWELPLGLLTFLQSVRSIPQGQVGTGQNPPSSMSRWGGGQGLMTPWRKLP